VKLKFILCFVVACMCWGYSQTAAKQADSPRKPLTDGQKLAIRTAQLNLSANGEKMKDKQREAADLQRQIAELQGKLAALEAPWNALNKERMELLDRLAEAFKAAAVKPEELDADLNIVPQKQQVAEKK
jgi:TolA-binding protein